ncbi:MAG: PKD domain-containing protein [Saprospiraceae bacterium]
MCDLFLPSPKDPNLVYLFSKSTHVVNNQTALAYQDKLKYAVVDLAQNNGLGKVITKNKTVLTDRFGYGQLIAVKHGNGRDWWLPMPVETGNQIFMTLFNADTVVVHHSQKLGSSWDKAASFQAAFSLDGSMYARYNHFYGLYLYDFDRCAGLLSNPRYFPFIDTTNNGLFGSIAFSPDNHYLYFPINYDSLCQMDLRAPDLAASVEVVATWDGSTVGGIFGNKFGNMVNGPDGRIYIIPPAYSLSMNVINRPNLGGAACDVQQHIFQFPNYYGNPPNFPNYRLGALDGSPCDTLGIDNHPLADFRPDPADTSGLTLQFWDVSSYAPTNWHWDFGDGTTSQDTSPVHTFAAPGFYTVCQTVSNAYGSDTHCKIVQIQTVDATTADPVTLLPVYPNPTTGIVHLPWREAPSGRVRVRDMTGRLVLDRELQGSEIDLGGLAQGLYVLTVQEAQSGKRWVGKVSLIK